MNRMNKFNTNIFYNVDLHNALMSKALQKSKTNVGFYVVAFRNMGKNSDKLVYNCIYYPEVFLNSFLGYILIKENFGQSLLFKEWGDFVTFIDTNLVESSDIKMIIPNILKGYMLYNEHAKQLWQQGFTNPDSYIGYLDILKKFSVVVDFNIMVQLLKHALNKDYYNYVNIARRCLMPDSTDNIQFSNVDVDLYLLKDCVFVVRDIKSFITEMKKIGLSANKGPQKDRGQPNSAGVLLSDLDNDYRSTLHKHHLHLIDTGHIDKEAKLSRSAFAFRNVHMKLGNVKWYSTMTTRNIPKKIDSGNIDSLIIKNRQKLFQNNYNIVSEILDKNYNMGSIDVQRDIELTLYKQEKLLQESLSQNANFHNNKLNFDKKSFNFIEKKYNELCDLLTYPDDIKTNTKFHSTKYIPLIKLIINELGVNTVATIILSYYLDILTRETVKLDSDSETPGISTISAFNKLGNRIFNKYIYNLYNKSDIKKNNGTLSQFGNNYLKENIYLFSINEENKLNDGLPDLNNENFYAMLGGYFVWNLVKPLNLLTEVLDKHPDNSVETIHYLRIVDDAREILIKNKINVYHIPQRLPMVCEPKDYVLSKDPNEIRLGGYLLNDECFTEELILDRIGLGDKPKIRKRNLVVSLVNGISKIPYKINTDTLHYIYKYGISKKIILDDDTKEIKYFISNPYSKKYTKKEAKMYRSQVSKILMERNILSIAETYSKVDKIYFPLVFDFRTRIYCKTDYFDYQKGDLARGLISFARPGIITKYDSLAIKYYKAFGANMFGNGLDKKSLNYRVKWVDENSDELLDFENNDIVDKAESKVCFISFCFEYKRFINFMNDPNEIVFYTYLPIQLDASCNGYQHLALLTGEIKLLSKLNLDKATHNDDPNDYYMYMLDITRKYIESEIERLSNLNRSDNENKILESYKKLLEVNLGRAIIKKVIMRESYSASIVRLVNDIISELDEYKEGKKKYYVYEGCDIKLTRGDIVNYVMCMKMVSKKSAPKIDELSKYLDEIVYICTKLDIPIEWTTPSGVVIPQSYLIEKEQKIAAFSFTKSKYTFKKYIKGKYDLRKQKRGIRPNWIHSLDGSVIAILYNSLDNVDLYTVHDCFAVTANNVPILIHKLKSTYIEMYSDNRYLLKFDNYIRMYINNKHGDSVFGINDKYINIPIGKKVEQVLFPDINKVINSNGDIASSISQSSYPII